MITMPELPVPSESARSAAHKSLMKAFEPWRTYCGWVDAPFGPVFVARTERGVCRVSFRSAEERLLDDLERRGLLPELAPERLDRERRQLSDYFEGKRRLFDLPIDVRWGTEFERDVLNAASHIPFGTCESYSDVARRIGRPNSQRAVGNALGKNPIAIVIPCHRVVASGGKLGGYTGGVDIKRVLMEIEGIVVEQT